MNAQKSHDFLLKKFDESCRNYFFQNADKIEFEQSLYDGAEALEKQIPKKVVFGYDEQDPITCPDCKTELAYMDGYGFESRCYKYCPNCGRKLDWSDTK